MIATLVSCLPCAPIACADVGNRMLGLNNESKLDELRKRLLQQQAGSDVAAPEAPSALNGGEPLVSPREEVPS